MATDPNACLRCGAALQSIGTEQFRIGGTSADGSFYSARWPSWVKDSCLLTCSPAPDAAKVEMRVPSNS